MEHVDAWRLRLLGLPLGYVIFFHPAKTSHVKIKRPKKGSQEKTCKDQRREKSGKEREEGSKKIKKVVQFHFLCE